MMKYKILKKELTKVLKQTNYHIRKTAECFNISTSKLYGEIKRYNIKWNKQKTTSENNSKVAWNKGLVASRDKRVASYTEKLKKLKGPQTSRYGVKQSKKWHKMMKEQFENNSNMGMKGKEAWNKGLTKEISEGVMKSVKTKLERIKKHNGQLRPFYNINACKFFRKVDKLYKTNSRHAEKKGGEYFISKLCYFLDFYSKKYNLVVEFNEEQHYKNNKLTDKHKQRQKQIKDFLKCKFINIRQKTFKEEIVLRKIELYIRDFNIKNVTVNGFSKKIKI